MYDIYIKVRYTISYNIYVYMTRVYNTELHSGPLQVTLMFMDTCGPWPVYVLDRLIFLIFFILFFLIIIPKTLLHPHCCELRDAMVFSLVFLWFYFLHYGLNTFCCCYCHPHVTHDLDCWHSILEHSFPIYLVQVARIRMVSSSSFSPNTHDEPIWVS